MDDMSVPREILRQLGGRRFIVMTGAKSFVGKSDSLSMRIPKGRNPRTGRAVNFVVITLTPADTYTVQTFYYRQFNMTEVERREDVYNDNLCDVFTAMTGLYVRL